MTCKLVISSIFAVFLFQALPAFAHVVVKPGEVGLGSSQIFTVSVPVEKDMPTIGVRLVIPDDVASVMPNAKPGWKIEVKKADVDPKVDPVAAKRPRVTEIEWSGGMIPVGQRDDFLFSAKAPASEMTLQWKAYQKYQDGTVVGWERDPREAASKTEAGHDSKSGPFSQTRVIDDLKKSSPSASLPLWLSIVALVLSASSFGLAWSRRPAATEKTTVS